MYNDTQLKKALAKMLPELLEHSATRLYWQMHRGLVRDDYTVLDTELLHLCWLVENTLFNEPRRDYINELVNNHPLKYHPASASDTNMAVYFQVNASWQQRTIALAKVKGIEI